MDLSTLKPVSVWEIFCRLILQIPHPSGKEGKLRDAIKNWVKDNAKTGVTIKQDRSGNLLIQHPGARQYTNHPSILLQGHMDMVCETNLPGGFKFNSTPIPAFIEETGKWVMADGTTLGADNGIGVSMMLALLKEHDTDLDDRPYEILLTHSEETGLHGALALDPCELELDSIAMINLDSENVEEIIIGSAGGGDVIMERGYHPIAVNERDDLSWFTITVSGLKGGHSGVDIHKQYPNAIKVLCKLLSRVTELHSIHVCAMEGGSRSNAIPRTAQVTLAIDKNAEKGIISLVNEDINDARAYYEEHERGTSSPAKPDVKALSSLSIVLEPVVPAGPAEQASFMNLDDSRELIRILNALPHGVHSYSVTMPGLVEISSNVAMVTMDPIKKILRVQVNVRSNIDHMLKTTRQGIAAIPRLAGWQVRLPDAYPGWKPRPRSAFVRFVKRIHGETSGLEVRVRAIHAGLEAGIIGKQLGLHPANIASIGPTILNAHSPAEKACIKDVSTMYSVLKRLILSFSGKQYEGINP
ncbi:beta-Ala-His dipeptidase [Candidatus Bathyarchaeota archaeon]|nr:beta-Ala-His dipeptidase [Candidatus Bathyarchaeota archaeon]